MSLDKDFKKFCVCKKEEPEKEPSKSSKVKELIDEAQKFLIFNRDKVDIGVNVAKALTSFAIHKTPFSLLEGALEATRTYVFDKTFYATDFFAEPNGWKLFTHEGMSFEGIFTSVLNRFPAQSLRFEYDNNTTAKLITLPFCKLGLVVGHGIEMIYYEYNEIDLEVILDFLVGEKLKELETNVISIDFKSTATNLNAGINLIPEVIFPIDSIKADFYVDYFQKCLGLGINRSILFTGPPGTGKTTLCQTIVKNLGFRTLKFRYNTSYDFNIFAFIVRKFKIEVVMIDDFDQCDSRDELLEFLEMLKKETKVVIGLANSLKDFHPALLRPGRFDEITVIDALDPKVVKEIIGPELSKKYFTKIKNWPVAYINEFVTRSKLLTTEELVKSLKELDERVKRQLERL